MSGRASRRRNVFARGRIYASWAVGRVLSKMDRIVYCFVKAKWPKICKKSVCVLIYVVDSIMDVIHAALLE
jgi:hypothetical protein